jgi:putative PEP-CTERM system TPR-repeat lipoprotein
MNTGRVGSKFFVAVALTALLAACGETKPDALIQSARQYIEKKDFPAAIIQLKNALKQNDSGEIRFLLAEALIEQGDYVSAQIQLRQALELKYPTDAIYPKLSKVMLGLGELKKLTTEFANVRVANAEQQASIKADIGEAYLALGQAAPAREAFAAAQASIPGYLRARVGEGRNIAAAGNVAGAIAIADDLLAKQPDAPHVLAFKADLLASLGKSEEAITVLTALIKVMPFNGQARFALVSLLIANGKFEPANTAIGDMKKALPRDIRGKYLEALLAFRQNEPLKARDAVLQVLNAIPDQVPAMLLAGAAEYQLGSLSTAADYLRKVIAKFPNNLYARNLLIATYLRQGQPAKAEDTLAPALLSAPNDPTVLRAAGEVAIANNRLKDAAKYYDQALSLERDNSALKTRLAQIRLASGETERALSDLEATSGKDQTQYQSDLALIATYVTRKEYDKALAAVAMLEKKIPTNPLAYSIKGAVYLAKNDTKNARMFLEKAITLQPNYLPAARALAGMDITEKNFAAATNRF